MILRQIRLIIFLLSLTAVHATAQDTLPKLTVRNVSNKIIISWKNTYGAKIGTINIQRSPDSLRNFTTIGSVLEPMNRENGFVDSKAPNPNQFYRVFVAFEGGRYLFTKSYRPFTDTSTAGLPGNNYLTPIDAEAPGTTSVPVQGGFVASKYIFTTKDNNVLIELPDGELKKYTIKFFDEKDEMIFEMKQVPEQSFIIEKVNFLHAGWFYFILSEDGILKEKNQFYIPKDGKFGIPPSELNRKFR